MLLFNRGRGNGFGLATTQVPFGWWVNPLEPIDTDFFRDQLGTNPV
jgi:hypothetical protein